MPIDGRETGVVSPSGVAAPWVEAAVEKRVKGAAAAVRAAPICRLRLRGAGVLSARVRRGHDFVVVIIEPMVLPQIVATHAESGRPQNVMRITSRRLGRSVPPRRRDFRPVPDNLRAAPPARSPGARRPRRDRSPTV